MSLYLSQLVHLQLEFTSDPIDCVTPLIATSVATLPDMQGSGAVRDLREAANDAAEWRVLA